MAVYDNQNTCIMKKKRIKMHTPPEKVLYTVWKEYMM